MDKKDPKYKESEREMAKKGTHRVRHNRTSTKGEMFPAGRGGAKKLISVVYFPYKDDWSNTTFELFEDADKAFDFAETVEPIVSVDLVKANNTYRESTGSINYEDQSDTIERIIKTKKVEE